MVIEDEASGDIFSAGCIKDKTLSSGSKPSCVSDFDEDLTLGEKHADLGCRSVLCDNQQDGSCSRGDGSGRIQRITAPRRGEQSGAAGADKDKKFLKETSEDVAAIQDEEPNVNAEHLLKRQRFGFQTAWSGQRCVRSNRGRSDADASDSAIPTRMLPPAAAARKELLELGGCNPATHSHEVKGLTTGPSEAPRPASRPLPSDSFLSRASLGPNSPSLPPTQSLSSFQLHPPAAAQSPRHHPAFLSSSAAAGRAKLQKILRACGLCEERVAEGQRWFEDQDCDSVEILREVEMEEEFVDYLKLRPVRRKLLLKRLKES
eukprot:2497415-Rhodomonas_salina.2